MKANHYDDFAENYSAENESSLLNAYYERPAMIGLVGDVTGHRVLDAGCGSGPLSAALSAKGAIMTGFDSSPAMLALARQRLGATADLFVADLSKPLPFADDSFDDVVSSLVLHYLEDWSAPLAELRRVLKPGGLLAVTIQPRDKWSELQQDESNLRRLYFSADLVAMFEAAGFREVRVEVCPEPDQFAGECVLGIK